MVQPKRVALAGILAMMIMGPIPAIDAQASTGGSMPSPAATQPAAPVVPVSTQLQPALSSVRQMVNTIKVDKWKRGNIRDEAAQNMSQIVRDIDVTLPPMLRDADTAPASLSKLLPISRNISALYDVLLRVVEASRVVASDDQVTQLQQALVTLGNTRLAFSERMEASAAAMEKQVSDLRATVQSQASRMAMPTPVAVPCIPPAPRTPVKKAAVRKPAAGTPSTKPVTTSGAKPTPAASTPPKPSPQTH